MKSTIVMGVVGIDKKYLKKIRQLWVNSEGIAGFGKHFDSSY